MNNFDLVLIREVKNRAFMYDKRNSYYLNTKRKIQAWEEIAHLLSVPKSSLIKRWKSLVAKFYREFKEIRYNHRGTLSATTTHNRLPLALTSPWHLCYSNHINPWSSERHPEAD
ncbi:hypothetical protein TKK_0007586 [Trichogramma kaykai]